MEEGRVERTWGVVGREVGDEGCTETNEHARKKPGVERETKIQGGRTWRGERKGGREEQDMGVDEGCERQGRSKTGMNTKMRRGKREGGQHDDKGKGKEKGEEKRGMGKKTEKMVEKM